MTKHNFIHNNSAISNFVSRPQLKVENLDFYNVFLVAIFPPKMFSFFPAVTSSSFFRFQTLFLFEMTIQHYQKRRFLQMQN